MSRISLADPNTLAPYLKKMYENANSDDWGSRRTAQAFATHPDLLENFHNFYRPFHINQGAGILDRRLKELVRLRVATLNGCLACKTARLDPEHVSEQEATQGVDAPDNEQFSSREKAALQYAERMAVDHFSIDDDFIREIREHFSEPELLELMVMTGQYIGFGRVAFVLHLEDATCPI
jgi:alkylhydroperoxidase family enzyme